MTARVGEVISVAFKDDEPSLAVVVSLDSAGTPETVPYDIARDPETFRRHVGVQTALRLAQSSIFAGELGL